MDEIGFNPLERIFGLFEKKFEADLESRRATGWLQGNQLYGVDEYGRVFVRGQAGVAAAPGSFSPLLVIGAGILAVTLIVWVVKS